MRSSFFGLETARRAMSAHRTDMDVIGHNIANANTEGYRKRDVALSPTRPLPAAGDQPAMGTGVEVENIQRRTDRYLDREIHRRTGETEMWDTRSRLLQQVEDILAEPGEGGLSSVMDRFYNAWQNLVSEPDNLAMRTSVIERGRELGDSFSLLQRQLGNMLSNLDQTVESRVSRVNDILGEISELNEEIVAAESAGNSPPDLLDRRDVLTERLSSLIDVVSEEQDDGGMLVTVDRIPVAESFSHRQMELGGVDEENNLLLRWTREGGGEIDWEPSAAGELGALMQLRNEDLPDLRNELAELADGVRQSVNDVHIGGYDLYEQGGDDTEGVPHFFDPGADPGMLSVNEGIINDPSRIRAAESADTVPGDGRVAAEIADLSGEPLPVQNEDGDFVDSDATPGEYLRSVVADVGIRSEQASNLHDNNDAMLAQLHNQRDALTGVSIDEELTYLIQAQQAFSASARMVQVWDEMLSTIVNGLVR